MSFNFCACHHVIRQSFDFDGLNPGSLVSWMSAIFERIWSLSSALDASQAWMSLDKNWPERIHSTSQPNMKKHEKICKWFIGLGLTKIDVMSLNHNKRPGVQAFQLFIVLIQTGCGMYQERLPRNKHNLTLSDVLLTLFTNVSEHGYDYTNSMGIGVQSSVWLLCPGFCFWRSTKATLPALCVWTCLNSFQQVWIHALDSRLCFHAWCSEHFLPPVQPTAGSDVSSTKLRCNFNGFGIA